MKKETFSEKVKKEVCSLVFQDQHMKALLSSFITNRLTVVLKQHEYNWRLTSQFPFIIEFIAKAFKSLYDCQVEVKLSKSATNINGLTNYVDIKGNLQQIENDLSLNDNWDKNELCSSEECRRAYVAGAFLAGGSINSLDSKSYHLEIRSSNYKYLLYLQALLATFKIYAVLTKHTKKQFILYLKKANQISDFLKLINAGSCMLEFEDTKISKDFNNNITRLNNLDVSNINKSTQTGVKQIKQIKYLQTLLIYKKQSKKFKAFCDLRLANASASLSELVDLMKQEYKIKTSRPGLNHIARKIDHLYNLYKEKN